MAFVDFLVRCQQGSGSESMNYIAVYVIDRIRRGDIDNPIRLARNNRALRLLKAEFPRTHAIWRYVIHSPVTNR